MTLTLDRPVEPTAGEGLASGGAVREMDRAEADHFLRRHEWGILCTAGEEGPYGVPVSYGYDGRHLFVASGPGRKQRNLEANPAACLTIPEVEDGDRWSTVVVTGEAIRVDELRGRLHALNAIRRQRAAAAPPSAAELLRAARATIYRIAADRVSGRARG